MIGSASSQVLRYDWQQWEMMMKNEEELSDIRVAGKPIAVSCAYSGRVAVAYKLGGELLGGCVHPSFLTFVISK